MPIFPSSRHGLGAIIEGPKQTDTYSLDRLGLLPAADVPSFSLERYIPKLNNEPVILNQGATSACVAHAFIGGIQIMETIADLPYMPCSRLFAYYMARREMGSAIVTDSGTYLRTCASGLRAFGVPDEKYWPFSDFTLSVNKRPSFDAMRYANPRAGGRYAKIYQVGFERVEAIKAAIANEHPVAFGTMVNVSFLDNNGSHYVKPDMSARAGGHAMLLIGWDTIGGETFFRTLNSWGRQWRDGGLCWLHESVITSPETDDLHVIYGWNRIAGQKAQA